MRSKKGAAYERDFSKRLSLWWSGGESRDLFWRTPMSGGKATVDGRGTHAGDIRAVLPEGEGFTEVFNVELKCGYPDADFQRLLDGTGGKHLFLDFVNQAQRDQALAGSKYWMLVIKRDRKKELVVWPYKAFLSTTMKPQTMAIIDYPKSPSLAVFQLEDLFASDPAKLYKELR